MNDSPATSESPLTPIVAEVVLERAAQISAAGMPLPTGLRAAAEEADSLRVARALRGVANALDRGQTLEEIVADSRRLPPHLAGLIRAAQSTPRLPVVLAEWLAHRRTAREHWRSIVAALTYPAICIALAIAVLLLFATIVVEPFEQMYEEMELKLPIMTIRFIWLCETLLPIITYCTGAAAVAAVAIRLVGGRAGWSWLMTNLPLVGLPWHWAGVAEMLHCLSLLVEQRLPLPEALRLTAGGIGDAYVAEQCRTLARRVENGSSLTMALIDLRTLPLSIVPLVHWGEGRDMLAESLRSAAEMIEGRLKARTATLVQVLPPIVFLVVGVNIASGFISLFLPLIDLISGLS
jgi:type II secretory pathway component PulF